VDQPDEERLRLLTFVAVAGDDFNPLGLLGGEVIKGDGGVEQLLRSQQSSVTMLLSHEMDKAAI
jgi:hypothetical protein